MSNQITYQTQESYSEAKKGLMTAEEMSSRGDEYRYGELIAGRFISEPPPFYRHDWIEHRISYFLTDYVMKHRLGAVMGGETGIITIRNPDTVRGADVVFISNERLSKNISENYLTVPPEIVVEVKGKNDRKKEMLIKLAEYFAMGVNEVWVADYIKKEIAQYTAVNSSVTYQLGDILKTETILPDFALDISKVFEIA